MYHTLLLFMVSSYFVAVTGALSIAFPSGIMEAGKTLKFIWTHTEDEDTEFFLRKIKLDEPDGPSVPSVPVPVQNSTDNEGMSSIMFDKPGLFEVLAIDAQNTQAIFTTEINILSPTSSISTPILTQPTSSSIPSSSVPASHSTPTNSSSTSDATKNHVAIVAGAVTGGVTGTVLLSITLILCWRRNRHKNASLRIPYPFYDEADSNANGAPVSTRGIIPPKSRARMAQQDRVRGVSPRVALSRTEEKRLATSRSTNDVHNDSTEAAIAIDESVTEVSEQPPSYTSEYQI